MTQFKKFIDNLYEYTIELPFFLSVPMLFIYIVIGLLFTPILAVIMLLATFGEVFGD